MTERRTITPGCGKLKSWLRAEGLYYQDLANMLGVAEVTIKGWANGLFRPDREHMATLEIVSRKRVPAGSWADPAEVAKRVGIARDRRAGLESIAATTGKASP